MSLKNKLEVVTNKVINTTSEFESIRESIVFEIEEINSTNLRMYFSDFVTLENIDIISEKIAESKVVPDDVNIHIGYKKSFPED